MQRLSVGGARDQLADALNRVAYRGERIIIEPAGPVLPPRKSLAELLDEWHWTRLMKTMISTSKASTGRRYLRLRGDVASSTRASCHRL